MPRQHLVLEPPSEPWMAVCIQGRGRAKGSREWLKLPPRSHSGAVVSDQLRVEAAIRPGLLAEVLRLEKENDALRETGRGLIAALDLYGEHHSDCDIHQDKGNDCLCGLDVAIERAVEALKKGGE